MRTFLLVLLTFLAGSEAWLHWGNCPDLTPKFNQYLNTYFNGTWYLRSGYNSDPIPGFGRCGNTKFTYNSTSKTAKVKFTHLSSWLNRWESVNGTVTPSQPYTDGKMILEIPKRWGFWDETMPYWVLTGYYYIDYTVVYSCKNVLFNFHYHSARVLSRSPDTDLSNVDDILKSFNLDPRKFVTYDQSNCTNH
ncbi:apolipoprotein D-like [Macrosteles quadrilineatus]|uniref:apolipoprotein D-like n=1 Tax=Macrosteles quadrilineatus TaxID=74068 RepID=UPI0023E1F73D|nr:apolipoprotein D-like [Macrosteles quadrilineatus]